MELKRIRILLIEDNPDDSRLIQEILNEEKDGFGHMIVADQIVKGLERLAVGDIDVVLLGLALPDSTSMDAFYQVQRQAREVPVIVLIAPNDEATVSRVIHEGAQDYLIKGQFDRRRLTRSILYSIKRKMLWLEQELLIATLQELVSDVNRLNGFWPICAHCKKIRDDQGDWHEMEKYIQTHTNILFTHSICPTCVMDLYAEFLGEHP